MSRMYTTCVTLFIWIVFFFFPSHFCFLEWTTHSVCVPLHSLSFVPTLLILSVFPFVLLDKVKQLLWGRGNVIGLLLRVSTNYFFIPLHRSLVVFVCQSCFTSCLACWCFVCVCVCMYVYRTSAIRG